MHYFLPSLLTFALFTPDLAKASRLASNTKNLESWTTVSKLIPSLTTNSLTTTSYGTEDPTPWTTVIPIWYEKPEWGIMILPTPGPGPGLNIFPPPGYERIIVDRNGNLRTLSRRFPAGAHPTPPPSSHSSASSLPPLGNSSSSSTSASTFAGIETGTLSSPASVSASFTGSSSAVTSRINGSSSIGGSSLEFVLLSGVSSSASSLSSVTPSLTASSSSSAGTPTRGISLSASSLSSIRTTSSVSSSSSASILLTGASSSVSSLSSVTASLPVSSGSTSSAVVGGASVLSSSPSISSTGAAATSVSSNLGGPLSPQASLPFASASATGTSAAQPTSANSGGGNAGAIAGGVAGGVAGGLAGALGAGLGFGGEGAGGAGAGAGGAEAGQNGEEDETDDENQSKVNSASQVKQSSSVPLSSFQSSASTLASSTSFSISTMSSTLASSTTFSTSTTSSMSISSSASTSASTSASASCTASACNECFAYDFDIDDSGMNPIDVDNSDDGGDIGDTGDNSDSTDVATARMKRRDLAKRFPLQKRGQKALVGNLVATGNPAIPDCTVSRYTYKPKYPGATDIVNNEAQPTGIMVDVIQQAKYWAIPVQPPAATACAAPVYAFVDTAIARSHGYSFGGRTMKGQVSVNMDHVYEVSLVDEFFQSQVVLGNDCANLRTIFNPNGDPTNPLSTRLNVVFNQIASYKNADFIGMDAGLNALKGSLWNANLEGFPHKKVKTAPEVINKLNQVAVIMSLLADPKAEALFLATNARLHDAFLAIDDMLRAQIAAKTPLQGASGILRPTWASDYQNWLTNKIATQNNLIQSKLNALSAAASSLATAPADVAALQAFNQAYKIPDLVFKYQIPWSSTPRIINFGGAAAVTPSISSVPTAITTSTSAPLAPSAPAASPARVFPANLAGAFEQAACAAFGC